MNLAEFAHRQLRQHLEALVRNDDAAGLHRLLSGEGIPALGGGEEPAEHILLALEVAPPWPRNLLKPISRLLARLVHARTAELDQQLAHLLEKEATAASGVPPVGGTAPDALLDDAGYVFNLFELSAFLPQDKDLFAGLHSFFTTGLRLGALLGDGSRLGPQLRRALIQQQADSRLRGHWLGLLKAPAREHWDAQRRTELADAWEGVLYLFDPEADADCGYALIDEALRTLHQATAQRLEHVALLKLALARLDEAFPTGLGATRFLDGLRPWWQDWPETLRDVAELTWPALRPEGQPSRATIPQPLLSLWQALPETERETLQALREGNRNDEGRRRLDALLFAPPPLAGTPPQQVRSQLAALKGWLFPEEHASLARELRNDDADDDLPASPRAVAFDRVQALEAANRTLEEVARRLRRGDLEHARRFLEEFVTRQAAQIAGDRHLHLAKTLTKAATLARDAGHLDWAEDLMRRAVATHGEDEVAASGLAEVLKAQGQLAEAETQYRASVARWPNNEVVACGLAEVLKAQGQLAEAETLYRANVARWPNDEVARHGLANVLRKRSAFVEALALLPEPSGRAFVNKQHLYDIHLRAALLADLGRLPEARRLMERGLTQAGTQVWRASFIAGLAWLDMRGRDFAAALARLQVDSPVVCLRIFRAHACAAADRRAEAQDLCRSLESQGRLRYDERDVVVSIERLYGLNAQEPRQPTEDEFAALIESEIDLALAA